MNPEERDLRRALEARSGEPSPQFRARLTSAFDEGRPASGLMQAVSVVVVVAITLGTVGILLMSRNTRHAGPAAEPLYTVSAPLLSVPGKQPLRACRMVLASLPPAGCSGVDVENVDPQTIPGVGNYPNGIVETPAVKLVGTWDGRVLHVTEPAVPAKVNTIAKPVSQPPPAGLKNANIEDIRRDDAALRQRGIVVLVSYGDPGPAVDLAVADARSVQYLYDHYGSVKITGWLQPIESVIATPTIVPPTGIHAPTTAQISAPSRDGVWVLVASTLLFRSTDRGATWEQRAWPTPTASRNLSFIDDHEGWVLAQGSSDTQCSGATAVVWHTTDAGATWQQVSSGISTQGMSYAQCNEFIYFYDSTHGFVTAHDDNHRPTIYRTLDGGKTWSGSTLPDPPDFKTGSGGFTLQARVFKRFANTLYVVASGMQNGDIPGRQYMFRSTDGGATWSWLMKIPSPYFAMVTESRWLQLSRPGQSMESTNGGQQWHPFASDFNSDTPVGGPQIVFADSLVGYAEGRGALQRTVDGGLHWERVATPMTAITGICSDQPSGPATAPSADNFKVVVRVPTGWTASVPVQTETILLVLNAPSSYSYQPTKISIFSFIGMYTSETLEQIAANFYGGQISNLVGHVTRCTAAGEQAVFFKYAQGERDGYVYGDHAGYWVLLVHHRYLYGLHLEGKGGIDPRAWQDAQKVLGSWTWTVSDLRDPEFSDGVEAKFSARAERSVEG